MQKGHARERRRFPPFSLWHPALDLLHHGAAPRRGHKATEKHSSLMSQHRSLRAGVTLGAKRNVLKRFERVELLKKRGQWKEGDRVTGLRKTKPES